VAYPNGNGGGGGGEIRPTFPEAPEGSTLQYGLAEYGAIYPEPGTLFTYQFDFVSIIYVSNNWLKDVMAQVASQLLPQGERLLAYALWRRASSPVLVPHQVCFFGRCWEPPLAGQPVGTMYHYRLWLLTRPSASPSAVAGDYRALAIPVIIAVILGALFLVPLAAVAISFLRGEMTAPEIVDATRDLFRAPGEIIAPPIQTLSWPLIALGLSLVAGSIAIPALMASAEVRLPVGGGSVSVGGGIRGPAPSGRK